MTGKSLSLILLPTLSCNAACEYCFERRTAGSLSLENLSVVLEKILDYMEERNTRTLLIYWQGGEVMTLPATWFEQAHELILHTASVRKMEIRNFLQSNMIGFTREWAPILSRMFNNSVGSSMDFPNRHRVMPGGATAEFSRIWKENVSEAIQSGIQIGVISIPNEESFQVGAERFYSHFVDDLGITDFQINVPFPGGPANETKSGYPLATEPLSQFLVDLFSIWIERGYGKGAVVGPFDRLLGYHLDGESDLPCIWRENCSNEFLCIAPDGHVAQCDCWVASYPKYRFGNIFAAAGLNDLLNGSAAFREFRARPSVLVQNEDCLDCDYLSICHGGCPVRAYTVYGSVYRKDPYCDVYRSVFRRVAETAAILAQRRSGERRSIECWTQPAASR